MRRGSRPCSRRALASRFALALRDQLVDQAAPAASAAQLLLHPPKELAAGLEHYAPTVDSRRELVPWLDVERTTHRGGQDEPALGSNAE